MKRSLSLLIAAAVLAAPVAAAADPGGRPAWAGRKQHPHGMPPGQAKKLYYRGDRIPTDARTVLEDYRRYRLPSPGDDQIWVRVDEDAYLTQRATGLVLDVIRSRF
jgi:Ni/Co efflux regulator RcnB